MKWRVVRYILVYTFFVCLSSIKIHIYLFLINKVVHLLIE